MLTYIIIDDVGGHMPFLSNTFSYFSPLIKPIYQLVPESRHRMNNMLLFYLVMGANLNPTQLGPRYIELGSVMLDLISPN